MYKAKDINLSFDKGTSVLSFSVYDDDRLVTHYQRGGLVSVLLNPSVEALERHIESIVRSTERSEIRRADASKKIDTLREALSGFNREEISKSSVPSISNVEVTREAGGILYITGDTDAKLLIGEEGTTELTDGKFILSISDTGQKNIVLTLSNWFDEARESILIPEKEEDETQGTAL